MESIIEEGDEPHPTAGNLMDSKTSHLDDLLSEKLEEAFHKQTFAVRLASLAKIASEHGPIDLAHVAARLPGSARPALFENLLSLDDKVIFMINTDGDTRAAVFRHLDDAFIAQLIQKMPLDEAVWVLEDLPDRRYRRIIETIEGKKALSIRELRQHDRHSAGRLMTNEFFSFHMDVTIKEAAKTIRDNPGIDLTRRIFVTNKEGELQGFVPARNLIINPPDLPLRHVMRSLTHQVYADTTREEVVDLVERYKISALPVVDEEHRLVGVITYEDVIEAIEDMADETIARMAGTAEHVGGNESSIKRFISRAPWLVITVCAGLLSAAIMSYFEELEANFLGFIVLFVPLITGISGNVGIQCSTVLVRSMAIGALSSGNRKSAITKEAIIGLSIGLFFGILCASAVYFFHGGHSALENGLIVGFGVFGACITSTSLGVAAPLFFARLGVDPAVASGPIVTAFNDVISMMMYFVISGLIRSFF